MRPAPERSGRRTATPACWSRWLRERGLDAQALETRYEGERDDATKRRRDGSGETPAAAMKAFADLYAALDETTATSEKVAALAAYFRTAPPATPPGRCTS